MANRQIEIENTTMNEVLNAMHRLGGQVTRKDIRQDIRDNSDAISEKIVDEVKTSKKSREEYRPFDYISNFAVKYLIATGYIHTDDNHVLELSEKGRNVDLANFNATRDVRPLVEKQFKRSRKQKEIQEDVEEETSAINVEDSWRQQLLEALTRMSPKKFELFCRGLLKRMGIDVDGGLDGFGYVRSDDYRTTRVALQAKRWQGKVSAPEIDKFRGAMDKYNAEFGIFITNSEFTRDAIKTARQGTRIITLINGDEICNLVAKYNYYVEPVTTYRLKSFYLDED
ncbi:restriction endonuclease [Limosilactobacillus oris]|uniref:Restriction endonuclease n=1 Tax=Limosilactobacillus oris PB013-T2-3 TaxID=908339 RepID=E3C5Z6_9LACO|nr:Mrr restriction system protein [Limosilactobacillus oris]EFQ53875.1 restriction endonuclease [Limosilactobacillus oris PB013-T2-3]MCW4388543.1 Mrr restriction system protein [Limosilactobacillus oris]